MGRVRSDENDKLDIGQDLNIDPDNLDVEWAEFSMTLAKYNMMLADAEKVQREAEENTKTVRSQLILAINDDPSKFGLDKVNMQSVEARYRTHKMFKKARKEEIEAKHETDSIRNVIFCLSAKRSALENLTKLLQMEYFSGPSESRNLGDKVQERKRKRTKETRRK